MADAVADAPTPRKQSSLAFSLLCFALIVILWWGLLWLVLPVEWLQGTLPYLVMVHVAPPPLLMAAGWTCKRAWVWYRESAQNRAKAADAAEKEAQLAADKAEHQEMLDRRRAHVQCRAIWAEFAQMPKWVVDGAKQCVLLEQASENLQGTGREVALRASLERVFETAFQQCEASVWVPVVLVTANSTQQSMVERAWREAVALRGIERFPQGFDCFTLSDPRRVVDFVIDLFEDDPALPAVIVVGMDSPLATTAPLAAASQIPADAVKPGHAVIAMMLNRPGLPAPDEGQTGFSGKEDDDPYTPFWERDHRRADLPQWERIPPPLRAGFWNLSPFAALHRSRTTDDLESKQGRAQERRLKGAIHDALIDSGLLDLPFKKKVDESEAPPKEEAAPAQPKPEEDAEPPEHIGWLVHDVASGRIGALSAALRECDCEIDPYLDASNLKKEYGDVGTAQNVLMLADALIRAVQLQKPVLMAGYNAQKRFDISLARPISKDKPADTKQT